MRKKMIPVIIAIVLILVIIGVAYGKELKEKYSYSSERVDLNEYFQIYSTSEAAVVLQDEVTGEKAQVRDGHCYFSMDFVKQYFTDRFYVNTEENILLYTTVDTIYKVKYGELDTNVFYQNETETALNYKPAFAMDSVVYIEAEYLKKFANFEYSLFENPYRVQLYTQWGNKKTAAVTADTACRDLGGVKRPIMSDIKAGTRVEILEKMDTWCKIKTPDAIVGYVENDKLSAEADETETPVTGALTPVYPQVAKDARISMGFCQVFGVAANESIPSMISDRASLNVIAPTWLRLQTDGSVESIADAAMVDKIHEKGMDVWVVATDVDYDVPLIDFIEESGKRSVLIQNLVDTVLTCQADGINIDFESVNSESAPHYIQFLRELSIATHANNLVLSVDNYIPTGGNSFYNRKEQGLITDYFVIMGYDEHWSGGEAGSVASIDFVKNGIEQTIQEVPKNKVINALPFYTRIWSSENGKVTGEAAGMKSAEEWFSSHSVEKVWDEGCCQYYGKYEKEKDGYIGLYEVWLEDSKSIEAKLNVMNVNQIAGAAYWKLGLENEEVWDVINAYVIK